jgi:NADP-dependent 3-hydroxy acid dehydrogenase YdfG
LPIVSRSSPGATRGIGRAVALAYAREGAHLILVGRTAGALEEVDDEIRALGGSATLLTLDLKTQDKIDALGTHHLPALEQARHTRSATPASWARSRRWVT